MFRDIDIEAVFDVDDSVSEVAAAHAHYQLLDCRKAICLAKHHELLQDRTTCKPLSRCYGASGVDGKPQHNEDRVRSVDKHQRLVFTAVPQRDQEQQRRHGLVVSGTDITVLPCGGTQTSDASGSAFATMPDAVIAVDGAFRVVYVNRAAERSFPFKARRVWDSRSKKSPGLSFAAAETARAGQNQEQSRSGTFVDPNGRELALDFSAVFHPA